MPRILATSSVRPSTGRHKWPTRSVHLPIPLITLAVSSRHSHLGLRLTLDSGRPSHTHTQSNNTVDAVAWMTPTSPWPATRCSSLLHVCSNITHTPFPTNGLNTQANQHHNANQLFLPVTALDDLKARDPTTTGPKSWK